MKIIQSFWSGNQKNIRENFGWYSSEFHWMGWILSVNQLRKYYGKVELYTDDFGYEILINQLKLPYTKVHVVLNDLDQYPFQLWALAKIKVYSMQKEPFIHVDGDVFIWQKFSKDLENATLIAQNMEKTAEYYYFMWDKIAPHLVYIPLEIQNFNNNTSNLSVNMGITGGTNLTFYKEYAQKAFEFVENNKGVWSDISLLNFNIFFEQVLFYEMSKKNNNKIDFLFSEVWEDNLYPGFADFHNVPHNRTYLHLMGDFKKNAIVCKAMEGYIMKYYPVDYSKLINLYGSEIHIPKINRTLNTTKVTELLKEFENEIKDNKFTELDFFLKRDLNNVDLNQFFYSSLKEENNFLIVLLPCFEIIKNDGIKSIEIMDNSSDVRMFELDEADEILLEELSIPTHYFDLIQKMIFYLEDQNDHDAIDELIGVINDKIEIFINLKIVSLCNLNI